MGNSSELHAAHSACNNSQERSRSLQDVTKPGSGKSNKPKKSKPISESTRREEKEIELREPIYP